MAVNTDLRNIDYRISKLEKVSSNNTTLPAPSTVGNVLTSDGSSWISAAPADSGGFPVEIHLASGANTTEAGVHTAVGGTSIDITNDYSDKSFTYKVSGYSQNSSTLQAVLYNVTDSEAVYTASINSSTPTVVSSPVTLSGNKFYEIRFRRSGGVSTDNVFLLNATIKIS